MEAGSLLSSGLRATWRVTSLEKSEVDTLYAGWQERFHQIEALGIAPETIRTQSFITPSCGVGSLSLNLAERVLALTRDLSSKIRESF